MEQAIPILGRGDLVTHSYKGQLVTRLVDQEGRAKPVLTAARERGVLFNVGHGSGSFSWEVTRRFFHYNHLKGLQIAREQIDAAFRGEKTVAQAMRDAAREANLFVEWKSKPTFPD